MAIRDLIPWSRGDNLPAYRDDPFMAFRREMDRLFDDAFRGLEGGRLYSRLYGTTWPRVEVTDSEREICITAEMPGMDEKDIEITFDDELVRGEIDPAKTSLGAQAAVALGDLVGLPRHSDARSPAMTGAGDWPGLGHQAASLRST